MQNKPYLRKPEWIRTRAAVGADYLNVKHNLSGLHTVCEEAKCPNKFECWERGTATFLILGGVCSRGCRFCSVTHADPRGILDEAEAQKVAEAIANLKIKYAVITSVDRDDLADFGATTYYKTISLIKNQNPLMKVEALIPDFQGRTDLLEEVIKSGVDVIAHNIETVERVSPLVRDRRASYKVSLEVLSNAKKIFTKLNLKNKFTKSSIILGFGETTEEVLIAMDDLRKHDVDVLVIGQYLQPSIECVRVEKYYHPDEFENFKKIALSKGFTHVVSGPMVRTSYMADEIWEDKNEKI